MSDLKRVRDWRARLAAAIEARRRIPYSEQDHCGIFLADCMMAEIAVDLFKLLRGPFVSVAAGIAVLGRAGYANLGEFLAAHLQEIKDQEGKPHPALAGIGDFVTLAGETGWVGGVVIGERVMAVGLKGLGTAARAEITRAFEVPR